ncbi:alpha-1,2-fucosyltransferase [bacterium]|nr:alpha-1,2-fucosyltransferase [bacterium]
MIIVRLFGGLGNQMFQYALGRRLSYINDCPLKFDTQWYMINQEKTDRRYLLSSFNIAGEIAAKEEIDAFLEKWNRFYCIFNKLFKNRGRCSDVHIVKERHYRFDLEILNIKGNVYLDGYWQSERYFDEIRDLILQDFMAKEALTGKNSHLAENILNSDSISMHIRRGDYISDERSNKYHGVCDLGYYERASSKIAQHVANPVFYVFSDEVPWARDNLSIDFPLVFVDHNLPGKESEDIRLMAMCRHNIIANSSFSWWGAWLNRNPEKMVIAPQRWFTDNKIDTRDLIPNSWIRL